MAISARRKAESGVPDKIEVGVVAAREVASEGVLEEAVPDLEVDQVVVRAVAGHAQKEGMKIYQIQLLVS